MPHVLLHSLTAHSKSWQLLWPKSLSSSTPITMSRSRRPIASWGGHRYRESVLTRVSVAIALGLVFGTQYQESCPSITRSPRIQNHLNKSRHELFMCNTNGISLHSMFLPSTHGHLHSTFRYLAPEVFRYACSFFSGLCFAWPPKQLGSLRTRLCGPSILTVVGCVYHKEKCRPVRISFSDYSGGKQVKPVCLFIFLCVDCCGHPTDEVHNYHS